MADGSIKIDVGMNTSKAEKELDRLKRKIASAETSLETRGSEYSALEMKLRRAREEAESTKGRIEDIKKSIRDMETAKSGEQAAVDLGYSYEKFMTLDEDIQKANQDLAESERLLKQQEKTVSSLEREHGNLEKKIEGERLKLEAMQGSAGEAERALAETRTPIGANIGEALDNARQKMIRFAKAALGIGSVYMLFRKLKSVISDSVKAFAQNDEETRNNIQMLKNSLAALQASWGAAFAPILNAVTPLLQTLIGWLTAAANAVSRFIAILSGRTTYKRAVANNDKLADSIGGAGAAAEKAKKQLMGFDELEILSKDSPGGGGSSGGGTGYQMIDELTNALDGSFISNFAISFKDVLFEWEDLNPEQIAKKLLAFLHGSIGGALGFVIGGVPGSVVGTLLGVLLSVVFDAVVFNNDGVLSEDELRKSLTNVLWAMTGGAIGFAVGGVRGALKGAALGAVLHLALQTIDFKTGGKLSSIIEALTSRLGIISGAAIGWKATGTLTGAVIGATVGASVTAIIKEFLFGDVEDTGDKLLQALPSLFPVAGAIIGWGATHTATGVIMGAMVGAGVKLIIKNIDSEKGEFNAANVVSGILDIIAGAGGAIAGFLLTGTPAGALIGFSVATGITLLLDFIKEKNPGSKAELLADVIKGTLISLAGAIVGFTITAGNPIGAFIGFSIGFILTLVLDKLTMDERKKKAAVAAFKQTELGQEVESIKSEIQALMEADADLNIRISSITGSVDESTLVNLGAAQSLIDDIFNLDAKENKTSAEAELLKTKIEALNGMQLPGIQLEFDETTNKVVQTRGEVQGLLDDLLKQYQMEAMHEAYVEAYKLQYEATVEVADATETAQQALAAYQTATEQLTAAQEAYNTALAEYNKYSAEITAGGFLSDEATAASNNFYAAQQALEAAKTAATETSSAVGEADTALATAMETYQTATESINGIAEQIVALSGTAKEEGINTMTGEAEGITEGSVKPKEAIEQAANETLDALRNALDSHSPSRETEQEGVNMMEGIRVGIQEGTSIVLKAMQSAIDAVVDVVASGRTALQNQMETVIDTVAVSVSQMRDIWQSDWGRPRVHFPVFSLNGVIDFATGQMPQITISDWLWAAKGGILDNATLIGAGEAGKEALIPLDRNTEWVRIVADGIMERMAQASFANQLADAFARTPMPAMANGSIIPPNSAYAGAGGEWGNSLMKEIQALRSEISALASQPIQVDSKMYMDRREVGRCVTEYQRQETRARG